MNEIILSNTLMPVINGCNFCIAPEDFLHADRLIDFNILIYVVEGCIYVTEGEIDYEVHAGELLFLKSGIRHFGKLPIQKGTKWHYVHFHLHTPADLFLFTPDESPIIQNTLLHYQTTLPKKLTNLKYTEIAQAINSLTDYFHGNDPMKKWHINSKFFNLLSQIAFYSTLSTSTSTLSNQICDYLTTHYTEAFSSSKLEQHFFLSYKHMAAVFKKEKQLTMQQYHTQIRMHAACKLLQTTLMPIGQISETLGYKDMLYFSRCFHHFIGMSPTDYRKYQISSY